LISKPDLEDWLQKMERQANRILSEINDAKVQTAIVNVGKTGESVVSFEYLREKADIILSLIKATRYEMNEND